MVRERPGRISRTTLAAALIAGTCTAVMHVDASAQGVRYSLTGTASQMDWDDGLGLANDRLFGVRAGIDFGPVVGLRGHYLWGNDFETELSRIDLDGPEGPLAEQSLDVKSVGGDLVVNVLQGSVVPYLTAGAGILRFDPADSERFDQIYGRLGAGVGFELSHGLRGDVWVANQRMRMDRYDLAPSNDRAFPEDPEADDLRSNWTYNLGLGLDLGRTGAPAESWSAVSFPVEAFAGVLNYDGSRLGDQNLAGLRAGVDMRYVGLRGFYWRGFEDGFADTQRVQGFGGEMQFNLQSGNGIAPFIVLGGGNLDYRDGFEDAAGELPGDQRFLIAGGGVSLRLTDVISINGSARDYLISAIDEEDVSRPEDLTHNWLFSAGIGVNLNRQREVETIAQAPAARAAPEAQRATDAGAERAARQEGDRQRAGNDSADRVIQIPVPEQGEIYIRYGAGGRLEVRERRSGEPQTQTVVRTAGLSDAQLNELADAVAEELDIEADGADRRRDEARRTETDTIDGEDLRTIVRDELEAMGIRRQLNDISESLDAVEQRQETQRARPTVAADTVTVVETPMEQETAAGDDDFLARLSEPEGYVAAALSEPSHMAFGVRVDAGQLSGMESISVVPEAAIGFVNDGTSVLAAGNLEYRTGELMISDDFGIRPAVRAGVGFLTVPDADTEGVLNITYGFSSGIGSDAVGESDLAWFVEHQGIDFFDRNRLVAGLRWTR